MRQGFITLALLANAVSSGLILWLLVAGGDGATRLSGRQGEVLIVVAAALLLDLLLVPVLGISFWARDRSFRRQATELASWRQAPPRDEPPD